MYVETMPWRSLAILGLFAALVYALLIAALPSGETDVNPHNDFSGYYSPVAHSLASGEGLVHLGEPAVIYPPGMPLLYAAVYRLCAVMNLDDVWVLRVLEALLLVTSTAEVFLLAGWVFGDSVGWIAGLLWCTYPFLLWMLKQPETTLPSMIPILGVFLLLLRWQGGKDATVRNALLVGLLLGIAGLVRPFSMLLPVFLTAIVLTTWRQGWKSRVLFVGLMFVANIVVFIPWEVWMHGATSKWLMLGTNGPPSIMDGITFSMSRGGEARMPEWLPGGVQALISDIVEHYRLHELQSTGQIMTMLVKKAFSSPVAVVELFAVKAARCWFATESTRLEKETLLVQVLVYLPLVVIGGVRLWRKRNERQNQFVVLTIVSGLYFWALTTLALSQLRYMLPAVPMLLVIAAYGLEPVVEPLIERFRKARTV